MGKLILLVSVAFMFLVGCEENTIPTEQPVSEITTGSFAGVVRTEDGVAISNVKIYTIPETIVTQTNSSGQYSAKDIEPGFYVLKAFKEGYPEGIVDMKINKGVEFLYNFVLEAIPPEEPSYSMTARSWYFNSSSVSFSHYLKNATESESFPGEFSATLFYARSVTTGVLTEYKAWEFEIQGERSGTNVQWASSFNSFKFEGAFVDENHIEGVLTVNLSIYHINQSNRITYSRN